MHVEMEGGEPKHPDNYSVIGTRVQVGVSIKLMQGCTQKMWLREEANWDLPKHKLGGAGALSPREFWNSNNLRSILVHFQRKFLMCLYSDPFSCFWCVRVHVQLWRFGGILPEKIFETLTNWDHSWCFFRQKGSFLMCSYCDPFLGVFHVYKWMYST